MSYYNNSIGSYLNISNESNFDIRNAISVMTWIYIGSFTTAWQAIITKGDNTWRLHRQNSTDYVCFHLSGVNNGNLQNSTININDGRIHHIAATYNGSRLRIFVDGVIDLDVAASGQINADNSEVRIGSNSQQNNREFIGFLEDTRVYNRGLSVEEIQSIYNSKGTDFILDGLVGRWVIGEGPSGTTINGFNVVKDYSVYENHATPVGSPSYYESILQKRRFR